MFANLRALIFALVMMLVIGSLQSVKACGNAFFAVGAPQQTVLVDGGGIFGGRQLFFSQGGGVVGQNTVLLGGGFGGRRLFFNQSGIGGNTTLIQGRRGLLGGRRLFFNQTGPGGRVTLLR